MTNFTKPEVPAGYREVSSDEFWNTLKNDKRDIMPIIIRGKTGSYWETNDYSRIKFGWSDSYLRNGYQYVYALK